MLATTLEGRLRYRGQQPICPHGMGRCDQYRGPPVAPNRTKQTVETIRMIVFLLLFFFVVALSTTRRSKPTFRLVLRRPQWSVFGEAGQDKAEAVINAQLECPVCLEDFEGRPFELQGCQLHRICTECAANWRGVCEDPFQAALCPVCRGGAEVVLLRSARRGLRA